MTTKTANGRTRNSGQRKAIRKQSYFPPQHGAWAFIGLPIALGFIVAPWSPLLLLVAVSAVAAFPLSHFITATLRYPHKERYRKPLILWASLSIPFALIVLVARPWLIFVGLGYLAALGLNILLAKNKRERSLTNDLVFIAECVALTPIMWAIGASSTGWPSGSEHFQSAPTSLWVITALAGLVLIDSTLHVKSLIRERNNPRYKLVSRAWSIVALVLAVVLSMAIAWPAIVVAVPFLYLVARSYVLGKKELKPGVLGVVELGAILLLVAAVLVCGG